MMSKTKQTVQVYELTIPNGTTAGTPISNDMQFRGDFKRCKGFCLHVASNANNEAVSTSMVLNNGEILMDFVHYQHLEANAATPVDKRYHPADFQSQNEIVRLYGKPVATLTADVVLQFVFLLESDEK